MKRCMRLAGFSLIELMVVITILSILALIGMPSYQQYIKRARFIEVITAVEPYKIAVAIALQSGINIADLQNGTHGIPDALTSTKNIASIVVENGTIIATATALANSATYILKPLAEGSRWQISGTCLKQGLCSDA